MDADNVLWVNQLSAWSTFATALLTLFLLLIAIWAGWTAVKTMKVSREANEQTKRDSVEQTRPYVYAEIIPSLAGIGTYDLRISNSGESSARDLKLSFSNWPEEMDDVAEKIKALFDQPRTLPPGCSIRSFWRLTGNFDDGTTETGMPDHGVIGVSYTSDDPSEPSYTDQFDFDIEQSGVWPVADAGPDPVHLKGDSRTFYMLGQAISRNIGEISR